MTIGIRKNVNNNDLFIDLAKQNIDNPKIPVYKKNCGIKRSIDNQENPKTTLKKLNQFISSIVDPDVVFENPSISLDLTYSNLEKSPQNSDQICKSLNFNNSLQNEIFEDNIGSYTFLNTLIIFDWDDCLFPSTWIRSKTNVLESDQSTLNAHLQEQLKILEKEVVELIDYAHTIGTVVIISNGHTRWLRQSSEAYYPKLAAKLAELKIPMKSARCLAEIAGCNSPHLWKIPAFRTEMEGFFHTSEWLFDSLYKKQNSMKSALSSEDLIDSLRKKSSKNNTYTKNYYSILGFGDQLHDRYAFLTAGDLTKKKLAKLALPEFSSSTYGTEIVSSAVPKSSQESLISLEEIRHLQNYLENKEFETILDYNRINAEGSVYHAVNGRMNLENVTDVMVNRLHHKSFIPYLAQHNPARLLQMRCLHLKNKSLLPLGTENRADKNHIFLKSIQFIENPDVYDILHQVQALKYFLRQITSSHENFDLRFIKNIKKDKKDLSVSLAPHNGGDVED